MKVLNISTNTHGGAGNAALRIHKAFLAQGLESYLCVKSNVTKFEQGVYEIGNLKTGFILKIVKRLIMKTMFRKEYLMYSIFDSHSFTKLDNLISNVNIEPDIIIFHWVADFISTVDKTKLKQKYPNIRFYWFLMDMAPITAGCHYAWGCDKYTIGCQSCPAAKNAFGRFLVRRKFLSKYKMFKKTELRHLAPNMFVLNQIGKVKEYDNSKVAYIPIDDTIFRPSVKNCDDFTILFGSNNFTDHRKGADLFFKVLTRLDSLLAKGNLGSVTVLMPGLKDYASFEFNNLKFLEADRAVGEHELANIYKRSDVFVCCSREDSGPMMISEAMMSGVPVVSFEVGAASELVVDNQTGYLVSGYDVNAMAEAILKLYSGALTHRLKRSVREAALERLSQKDFVRIVVEEGL